MHLLLLHVPYLYQKHVVHVLPSTPFILEVGPIPVMSCWARFLCSAHPNACHNAPCRAPWHINVESMNVRNVRRTTRTPCLTRRDSHTTYVSTSTTIVYLIWMPNLTLGQARAPSKMIIYYCHAHHTAAFPKFMDSGILICFTL